MPRWRITVRAAETELRGYVDGFEHVEEFADAVKPLGWLVMASPADPDYDPFAAPEDGSA